MLRAFDLAGTPPTPELKQLWETYKEAQEKEGKKVHTGGGFSGKGGLFCFSFVLFYIRHATVEWFTCGSIQQFSFIYLRK